MTIFNPSLHKSLFATGASAAERIWSIDMLMKVFDVAGLYNITINNTPATPPASSSDIWVLVDSTDATPAAVKYWNGTSPSTNAANWLNMTPAQFASMSASSGGAPTSVQSSNGAVSGVSNTFEIDGIGNNSAFDILVSKLYASAGNVQADFSRNGGTTWINFNNYSAPGIHAGNIRLVFAQTHAIFCTDTAQGNGNFGGILNASATAAGTGDKLRFKATNVGATLSWGFVKVLKLAQ